MRAWFERAGRMLASRRVQIVTCVLLFLLGAGLRLWFVLSVHPPAEHLVSDMWVYDFRARRLLSGQHDLWDTFTPVGYPAILALVYSIVGAKGIATVGVLQALAGGASATLTQLIGMRFGLGALIPLLAGLAVALHYPLIFYSGLLLSESAFAFFIALSVWLLLRATERPTWGRALVAGLVAGIATVVRPNLLAAYPFAALFLWVALRPDRRAWLVLSGRLVLGALPPIAAAVAHNSHVAGQPAALGTNGGLNFFLNFAEVSSVKYKDGGYTHYIAPIPNLLRYRKDYHSPRPFYDERFFYQQGLELIRNRPRRLLRAFDNLLEGSGAGKQDYWPGWHGHEKELERWSRFFAWLVVAPALLHALLLGVSGRFRRKENAARVLVAGTVLSSFLVLYWFLGDPRVRVPFDPLIYLLALDGVGRVLGGIVWLIRRWRSPAAAAASEPVPDEPHSQTL